MNLSSLGTPNIYKSLPKIDLHRHLEGSIRLTTMLDFTNKFQIDVPVDRLVSLTQVNSNEPQNYQNFLSKFATIRNFFQSPEAIERITREAIIDAAEDNVKYLELRFTPVALSRVKDFYLSDVIDWVLQTANTTAKEYGITTRLIASVNRHESVKLAEQVAALAADRQHQGIVAIDLAGSEVEFPGEEFGPVFREAKTSGLHITIHAGEWGRPKIVKLAIHTLGAERIGHGIRIIEDPEIIELAKEKGIIFEVCPTSNYQSGAISPIDSHPIHAMIQAGLLVTINSDDPAISQIDLSHEYELAVQKLGLSMGNLETCIFTAIRGAFLSEKDKSKLLKTIGNQDPKY